MSFWNRVMVDVLLSSTMLIIACGGDDDDGEDEGDGGGDAPQVYTCFASVVASEIAYVITGDRLDVSADGQSEVWQRVADGDGGRPVYGTWHVGTETTPGVGTVSLDFLVEPAQVSVIADCDFGSVSATARASSSAEITDTTIAILEFDEDTQIVTR